MRRLTQDAIVTAVAGVTSLATALILVFFKRQFGFSVYSFMLWFIIPIGAIISGFVAASGYYVGARLLNHKPTRLIVLNMLALSVGMFFLIHYLNYSTLTYQGSPVNDYVTFPEYLNIVLNNMSMNVCFHAVCSGGGVQLGAFGYVVAVSQVVGFFVGAVAVYGGLVMAIYCDDCSRYYTSKLSQQRYFTDATRAAAEHVEIVGLLHANQYQAALDRHAASGMPTLPKNALVKSETVVKFCERCLHHHYRYGLYRRQKNDWKEIPDSVVRTFTEQQVGPAQAGMQAIQG